MSGPLIMIVTMIVILAVFPVFNNVQGIVNWGRNNGFIGRLLVFCLYLFYGPLVILILFFGGLAFISILCDLFKR